MNKSAPMARFMSRLTQIFRGVNATNRPHLNELARILAQLTAMQELLVQKGAPAPAFGGTPRPAVLMPAIDPGIIRRLFDPANWRDLFPILDTDYLNVFEDTANPGGPLVAMFGDKASAFWSGNLVGGSTFPLGDEPAFEWVPVLNPVLPVNRWTGHQPPPFSISEVQGILGMPLTPMSELSDEDKSALEFAQRIIAETDFTTERLTAMAGTALAYNNAVSAPKNDVPFDHPFGTDSNFNFAPDEEYWYLLAITSLSLGDVGPVTWFPPEDEVQSAIREARDVRKLKVPGTMHVEMEQGILPQSFRPQPGDRVVIFGRWIVDAGHDSFGTELHPPLLVARANCDEKAGQTVAYLLGRPWLASQTFSFDDDGMPRGFRAHLESEVSQLISHNVLSTSIDVDPNAQVTASPVILSGFPDSRAIPALVPTFVDRPFEVTFNVRAPEGTQHVFFKPGDSLFLTYSLTVRPGVNVSMARLWDATGVRVTISASDYVPPPIPHRNQRVVKVYYEDGEGPEATDLPNDIATQVKTYVDQKAAALRSGKDPMLAAVIIAQPVYFNYVADQFMTIVRNGVVTYQSDPWPAPDPSTNVSHSEYNVRLDQWPAEDPTYHPVRLNIDESQVYPISGEIVLTWGGGA